MPVTDSNNCTLPICRPACRLFARSLTITVMLVVCSLHNLPASVRFSGDPIWLRSLYLDLKDSGGGVRQSANLAEIGSSESINILLLQGDQLGANYDIADPSRNIREQFEEFGWNITTAALSGETRRCDFSTNAGLTPQTPDLLISEIPDISEYDILCLLPNRSGSDELCNNTEALGLVKAAADSGLVVAAWCRTVRVLAAADLIDGLDVVGHADYESEYETAGATYKGNDHPPIIQGNIVTAVRSRYYRTEMCEAIRDALPPTTYRTGHQVLADSAATETIVITSIIKDHAGIYSVVLHVDTGAGFVAVTMHDSGRHGDDKPGDSKYGAIIPSVSKSNELRYYLHVVDSVGRSAYAPPDAPDKFFKK